LTGGGFFLFPKSSEAGVKIRVQLGHKVNSWGGRPGDGTKRRRFPIDHPAEDCIEGNRGIGIIRVLDFLGKDDVS
jgi:hypothetical protein